MKTILNKIELLPLLVTASIVVALFVMFFEPSHNMYANPKLKQVDIGDYTITGREYKENGVVFDIPKEGDPSREAAVVSFTNHAVIPSYVTVDGIRYTVRVLRYGAPQTIYGDTTGWVTLPPTLKTCSLYGRTEPPRNINPIPRRQYLGSANVNITNLDSFLNMDYFCQDYYVVSGYDGPAYPETWKLYLNGQELKNYDYVYPEGSSLGTSLVCLSGIRSVTVPASDTLRRKNTEWVHSYRAKINILKFKADSGYDLRYYQIPADTIVFPRYLKEFNGYGVYQKDGIYYSNYEAVVARWPENLEHLVTTLGLKSMRIENLPTTVTKVGGKGYPCYFSAGDNLTIPKRLTFLGQTSFSTGGPPEGSKKTISIEDSDQPLHISGGIKCIVDQFDTLTVYFGRNLVSDTSPFSIPYLENKTATIVFGDKVTDLQDDLPIRLGYNNQGHKLVYPKNVVCMGLTPPNFNTALPKILDWKFETVLWVPEAAEQAYRNHPVWKYFYIIMTHNGVDEIITDKEVAKETWYSLDGKLLGSPEPGKINIRVTTYTDGTTRSHKVAVPQE